MSIPPETINENTNHSIEETEKNVRVAEKHQKIKRSPKEILDLVLSIILTSLLFISAQYFLHAASTAFANFKDIGIEYIVYITRLGVYMAYYRYLRTKIKPIFLRIIIFGISVLVLAVFATCLFNMQMTYAFV